MVIRIKEIEKFSRSPEYAKIKAEVEATKARVMPFIGAKAYGLTEETLSHLLSIQSKDYDRKAYNAAYQRDLRTIKRLGLSVSVAEWRKTNAKS